MDPMGFDIETPRKENVRILAPTRTFAHGAKPGCQDAAKFLTVLGFYGLGFYGLKVLWF